MALGRNGYVQPVEGVAGGIPIPVATPNRSSFSTNQKNVAAAGTGVQLPAQAVPDGFFVAVIAKKTNVSPIYLGNSKANAENHAIADILGPGDIRRLQITNWDLMWIDGANGEGVTIISEA